MNEATLPTAAVWRDKFFERWHTVGFGVNSFEIGPSTKCLFQSATPIPWKRRIALGASSTGVAPPVVVAVGAPAPALDDVVGPHLALLVEAVGVARPHAAPAVVVTTVADRPTIVAALTTGVAMDEAESVARSLIVGIATKIAAGAVK